MISKTSATPQIYPNSNKYKSFKINDDGIPEPTDVERPRPSPEDEERNNEDSQSTSLDSNSKSSTSRASSTEDSSCTATMSNGCGVSCLWNLPAPLPTAYPNLPRLGYGDDPSETQTLQQRALAGRIKPTELDKRLAKDKNGKITMLADCTLSNIPAQLPIRIPVNTGGAAWLNEELAGKKSGDQMPRWYAIIQIGVPACTPTVTKLAAQEMEAKGKNMGQPTIDHACKCI